MIVKVLRFLLRKKIILPVILFIVGIYISTFSAINIHITAQQNLGSIKYDQFYDIELVPNKPQGELIVYPDHVNIYNHLGEQLGEMSNTPLVYTSNGKGIVRDSLMEVRGYGWVWKESIGGDGKLIVPENIRYRSNSHIIATLKSGTRLDTIYTNELKSWTLVTFICYVPESYLLTHDEYDDIPGIKKISSYNQLKTTDTRRTGGVSVKPFGRPIIKFEELIWPVRLVMTLIICSFFIWLPGLLYLRLRIREKRKMRMNALILIISGMITGSILHWEIYSSLIRL